MTFTRREDFAEQLPHAVIVGNCLRGLGRRRFREIHDSLVKQGIEPRFLQDPRVVQAALDDLVDAGFVAVWPTENGALTTLADRRYELIHDPFGSPADAA